MVVLFKFIMWWLYLISLCGCFDAAHWDFLSVSLLSFIDKRATFTLKVNRDVGYKSEMEGIFSLCRKNKIQFQSSSQIRKLNSFND